MEKLSTPEILDAGLGDWRKLAQALHARYRIADFRAGAAFVALAVAGLGRATATGVGAAAVVCSGADDGVTVCI